MIPRKVNYPNTVFWLRIDYVYDLALLINKLLKPLVSSNIISESEKQSMFSNVEELVEVNKNLLVLFNKLSSSQDKVICVADAFLEMVII